jgi:iron complex outermembrane receptor protein
MNAFVQDEARLAYDRVHLTGGVKLERADLGGWSIQPSVRVRWTPQRPHTIWAAVSRAMRAPSRAEHDMGSVSVVALASATGQLVVLDSLEANRAFRAERLLAFELGYRGRVAQRLRLDVATYLHRYDGLRALATWLPHPDPTAAVPTLVAPVQVVNGMHGHTWGLEVAAEQRPRSHWRLRASYTFQVIEVEVDRGRTYLSLRDWEGSSPRHQLSLRSIADLSDRLQLDLWGRYVDRLAGIGVNRYVDLDARLNWRISPVLEASLVGQNLLTGRREEFRTPRSPTLDGDEQRAAYASLRWRF